MTPSQRAILVLVTVVAFVLSPVFSGSFGGFDPDRFPIPQVNPPVQPAGYAFSIWGLIYLWLVVHAVWGLARRRDDAGWDRVRLALALSTGIGATWIPVAQVSPLAATVLIWVMLLSALAAMQRSDRLAEGRDRWLGRAPLAIYAGWLTAASWVSVGLVLGGWGILSETVAALLSLALAVVFAAAVQLRTPRPPEYGLTVVWALVAVLVANLGGDGGWLLPGAALAGAAAMAGAAALAARPSARA